MLHGTQQFFPQLEELEAFVRIAELGSLTAAAQRLRVPKSTLSRRLSRLEEGLGAQLLTRTTRKLHLTEVGAAYLERIAPALAHIDEANREAQGDRDTPRGHLRITAPVDLATTWLPPLIATFCARHPAVTVEVLVEARFMDLVGEGIDLAVRPAAELADSGLVARRISTTDLALWASPRYLRRRSLPRVPADLERHVMAVLGPPIARLTLRGPEGVRHTDVKTAIASNDPIFLRELALKDGGIVILPSLFARADLGLVRVLPDWALRQVGLYLVHPAARVVPAKVRAFRDYLTKHAPDSTAYRALLRRWQMQR
ncbi:LysR family transcriptional regulator [Pendulispora brunnea]|uniref:LysR family transcriptional regulator n=1 Tax=Pendulispora brunnea TaxID=2905690 RepID=A0ABZ2KIC5_9BACT